MNFRNKYAKHMLGFEKKKKLASYCLSQGQHYAQSSEILCKGCWNNGVLGCCVSAGHVGVAVM